ncbi:hypothetical protein HA466_0135120 [Hirschfeldia incana]|nr:hypothetical protein HA466_0135120 [Hirschfeldia incana]
MASKQVKLVKCWRKKVGTLKTLGCLRLLQGGGDNDGGDMGGDRTIPAKVESGGSSGEASLIAATETIGRVPKMNDPTSQVVKKARMA